MPTIYAVTFLTVAAIAFVVFKWLAYYELERKKAKRVEAMMTGHGQGLDNESYDLKNELYNHLRRGVEIFLARYIKDATKNSISNDLYLAGKRSGSALIDFYVKRFLMCAALLSIALMMKLPPLHIFLMSYVGFMLPKLELDSIRKKRQKQIKSAFPISLDMIVIGLEAGYNLDKALNIVINNIETVSKKDNIMVEEYKVLMNELQLGLDVQTAWNNLYKRTQIDELKEFVMAVLQSESIGAPLSSTLRNLSMFIMKRREQDLESVAASMGAKMSLPLAVCILPVILGFVTGPFIRDLLSNKLF